MPSNDEDRSVEAVEPSIHEADNPPLELESLDDIKGFIRHEIRVSRYFSGPIPPPEVLDGYNKINSSYADTIMQRAGIEQEHRHTLARTSMDAKDKLLDAQIRQSAKGQSLAAILGVCVVIAITLIGIFGDAIAGPAAAASIWSVVRRTPRVRLCKDSAPAKTWH